MLYEISEPSKELGLCGQDVNYVETLNLLDGGSIYKCKIDIRSNAYKFQSHARAYVWSKNDLRWNLVDEIMYSNMKTEEALYCNNFRKARLSAFKQDRDTLVEKLKSILS